MDSPLPGLDEIRRLFSLHSPRRLARHPRHRSRAATALILCRSAAGGTDLLLMKRTRRAEDPWSGHISLPGGRPEEGDLDLAATARREAREEVGIKLAAPFGRLDDIETAGQALVVISPFIFALEESPLLCTDRQEVESVMWIPLAALLDPGNACTHLCEGEGIPRSYPALRFHGHIIWGLTYRTLQCFSKALGHGLPQAESLE